MEHLKTGHIIKISHMTHENKLFIKQDKQKQITS